MRATSPATLFKSCWSLNWVRWSRAESRANAVRLLPIYTVRKIVSAKASLWFILNQNLVFLAYLFTSEQAVNCFKQINDTPVCSQFYAQCRQGLKIFAGSILRRFQCESNFVCGHAAQINPLYVVIPQYKYHTVLSLQAKTIVTCVRIFWEVKAELVFFWRHNSDMVGGRE